MPEPPKRPTRPSQAVRPSTAKPPVAGRQSQVDRALALRDAVEQAISTETEFRQKTGVRQSNVRLTLMLLLAVPLVGFTVYSWVARPAYIWGTPPPIPVAQQDANMRMTLYVIGMRLKQYRAAQGFYPASLETVGERAPGVTYGLLSDSLFELRAVVGRQPMIYRSDMNAREYLGNAQEILSRRRSR
jgi:hypothetical protein